MRIQIGQFKRRDICFVLFVLLITECFFPPIVGYAANLVVFLSTIYRNNGKLSYSFREMNYLYLILVLGLVLGAFYLISGRFAFRDYSRDIYYFTTPVFIMLNGAYIRKTIKEDHVLFNTVIIVGGIQASYYFFHAGMIIYQHGLGLSFRNWRRIFGDASPLAAATIILILLEGKKQLEERNKRIVRIIILLLCIAEVVFSMSRTNISLILITGFVLAIHKGLFRKVKKIIKFIIPLVIVIILSVVLLEKVEASSAFISKFVNTLSEINSSLDWSDTSEIQQNWRGYETHCAIEQFKNYPMMHQLIGYGFGERIEVGIYAYRFLNILNVDGSGATSIPVLHNGYATMLCKLGILGIILYVGFYLSLISLSIKHRKTHVNSGLLAAITIAMAIETISLNGLFRQNVNYPFIYMMGYLGYALATNEILYKDVENS